MGNCVHKLGYLVDHNAHLGANFRGSTPLACKVLLVVIWIALVFLTIVLCIYEYERYQQSTFVEERRTRLNLIPEKTDIHIFNLNQVR